jgi:hypothetical protein
MLLYLKVGENMEVDLGINNKVDLYKRLLPALRCKTRELEKYYYKKIRNEDIWNYLLKNKWGNVTGLSLSEMVDDILNLNNDIFKDYIFSKEEKKEEKIENEIELL